MKFKTNQNTFNRALSVVSRIAGGIHSTLPILSNVMIKVEGSKAELITTNLDMAVQTQISVKDAEDGVITAPAKLLAEFISNLPSDTEIEFSVEFDRVKIAAGSYESIINGINADDFPAMPDIDEKKAQQYSLGAEEFKNGVSQVIIACSTDYTRPALTGVYFNTFEGDLYVAGTDGYRLAELKLVEGIEGEVTAIVPSASLREVLNAVDAKNDVEILFDDSQIRFRLGDTEITSKLIEGSYPNYRALLPKELELDIELEKSEMLRVTKIAALFARQSSGTVTCKTDSKKGEIIVSAVANEMGTNDSVIKAKVDKDTKVNLNSRYLLDALNALSETKIRLGFSKVNSMEPIMLKNGKSDDYRHIVMPMANDI